MSAGFSERVILDGSVVRRAERGARGYWAGAPGAYAGEEGFVYLSYRIRRPRGVSSDRGAEVRIARSRDGVAFDDVCVLRKEALDTPSMERSALVKGPEGSWRLFLSLVDPADDRWCVRMMRAETIEGLTQGSAVSVFRAGQVGVEGVKDPWLVEADGRYYMFLSVASATAETTAASHATADIYDTGQCLSQTALATSDDLETWQWHGTVLTAAAKGWDCYCRRLTATIRIGERWIAFYDGLDSAERNYEERAGLAESADLRHWRALTEDGPLFRDLPGSGAFRYVDFVRQGDRLRLFYELARPDGSHDLLTATCREEDIAALARRRGGAAGGS